MIRTTLPFAGDICYLEACCGILRCKAALHDILNRPEMPVCGLRARRQAVCPSIRLQAEDSNTGASLHHEMFLDNSIGAEPSVHIASL